MKIWTLHVDDANDFVTTVHLSRSDADAARLAAGVDPDEAREDFTSEDQEDEDTTRVTLIAEHTLAVFDKDGGMDLFNALSVFVHNPQTWQWLLVNDPQAAKQACLALIEAWSQGMEMVSGETYAGQTDRAMKAEQREAVRLKLDQVEAVLS